MALISNRISVWMETKAKLESQDGRQSSREPDGERRGVAALGSPDPVVAYAEAISDLAPTQAARPTCTGELAGKARFKEPGSAGASLGRCLSKRHSRSLSM